MSAHDLFVDGFPHGTKEGYDRGCKGSACPVDHWLSCRVAAIKARGDFEYRRLVADGLTPAEIAEEMRAVPARPAAKAPEVVPAVVQQEPVPAAPSPAPGFEVFPKPERVGRYVVNPEVLTWARFTDGMTQSARHRLSREVRAWARGNGWPDVADRATMPRDVLAGYVAAGGGWTGMPARPIVESPPVQEPRVEAVQAPETPPVEAAAVTAAEGFLRLVQVIEAAAGAARALYELLEVKETGRG